MPMYNVSILPMEKEDIVSNIDYIAFEKKASETALRLAMGFGRLGIINGIGKNSKIIY